MDFRFEIPLEVPVEEAWSGVTDLSVLARCFPGARLDEETEQGGRGTVVVALGPIRFEYQGEVTFIAKDTTAHKAVVGIMAADTSGGGQVSARITMRLDPNTPARTALTMEASVDVTGRAAQFGRGMLEDVAQRLLHNFADRLAAHSRGEDLDGADSTGGTLDVFSLVPPRALVQAGAVLVAFAAGVLVGRALSGRR